MICITKIYMRDSCFFTIVTVSYNAASGLEKTIKSILRQKNTHFEYVIIDGNSQDNTIDVIKKYEPLFGKQLIWVSERDKGIYDAMNKGVSLSHGEYIVFINSDDEIHEDALDIIEKVILETNDRPDIVYGDSLSVYMDEKKDTVSKLTKAVKNINLQSLRKGMGLCHQSMYTHRTTFEKIGGFNLQYPIGADWDFLIRCVKEKCTMRYIEHPLSVFLIGGVSSKNHLWQRHIIRKNNALYEYVDVQLIKELINPVTICGYILGNEKLIQIRYLYNKVKKRMQNGD